MLIYSYWITTRNASLLIDGFDEGLITVFICTLNPFQHSFALWNIHLVLLSMCVMCFCK